MLSKDVPCLSCRCMDPRHQPGHSPGFTVTRIKSRKNRSISTTENTTGESVLTESVPIVFVTKEQHISTSDHKVDFLYLKGG